VRIQLVLAEDGSTVTVRADRYSLTMPPARVAAALATAVESALQTHRPAPLELALVDPAARELAPVELAPVELAPVEPALDEPALDEPAPVKPARVEPAPAAGAPATVPAPRVGDGAGRDDGEVRVRALRLLDDGLTDAQVCAQLGISRGRLLRWDDDLARDAHLDELAGVGR